MNTPTDNTLEPANGTRSSGAAAAIVAAVVIILGVIAWILLGPARDTWNAATQPAPNATSTVTTSTPSSTDGIPAPTSTAPETPTSALPFGADQVLALGAPAQLFEGDVVIFATSTAAEGTLVTVKGFTDSRCPADVQCIWAGERGVALEVTSLRTGQKSEISLKERTNPKVVLFGRTFTLREIEDGKGGDYAEVQVD